MRRISLLLFLMFVGQCALAQSYGRLDFTLQNAQGQAIAGATINVYSETACGVPQNGTQAQLYSSATGGAISQPLYTDGFGSASAYAAPGCVTVVYYSDYTGTRTFIDQNVIAGSSGGSGTFVALSGDATSTATGGATTVNGLKGVPFCNGYTPTNGQSVTLTTASSPNPCYTATTGSGGGLPLTGGTLTGPLVGTSAAFSGTVTAGAGIPIDVDVTACCGAFADGMGTSGTDQSVAFQNAQNLVNAAGGGSIHIPLPANGKCYAIGSGVVVGSNTTWWSESPNTCVQRVKGTAATCSTGGCGSVFYTAPAPATASNVWYKGFTIDGNRANIAGITGDGGLFGVLFQSASNSGLSSMTVENAYTGGVTVSCTDTTGVAGNNVGLLNTIVTNSRRNNLEVICGTNTHMVGGQLSNSNGGSLNAGVDLEPDGLSQPAQLTDGFAMSNVEIFGNTSGGIIIQHEEGANPTYTFTDLNVHDNGSGSVEQLSAINYMATSAATASGTISISGGRYSSGASCTSALSFAGFKTVNVTDLSTYGCSRGVLSGSWTNALNLSSSSIAGTTYDLDPNAVTGSVLNLGSNVNLGCQASGATEACVNPSGVAYIQWPMTGQPQSFTLNGLAYWPASVIGPGGSQARTAQMAVSSYVGVADAASNPDIWMKDSAGNYTKCQTITGPPAYSTCGSQSSMPSYMITNNIKGLGQGTDQTVQSPRAFTAASVNYIATETGANNALIASLPLPAGISGTVGCNAGLRVSLKIAHSLQAGANTLNLASPCGAANPIVSHGTLANITTPYTVGAVVDLLWDGTNWEDMSQ